MMRIEVSSFVAKRPAAYRQRKAMRMRRRFPLHIEKAGTKRLFKIMLTSRRTLLIEWGDCDPAGIVYFPRYFAIFDACTSALIERALGMTKHDYLKAYEFAGHPLVDARSRFIIPPRFGDDVTIE